MFTNFVGQEFGQSTTQIAYVCSAIGRTPNGQTPQLEVTHHLGTGIFWSSLHSHVWWLMLAVMWDLFYVPCACGLGFLAEWPAQSSKVRVLVNKAEAALLFSTWLSKSCSILLPTSTSQAHPNLRRTDTPLLSDSIVKKSVVFFELADLPATSLHGNILRETTRASPSLP